MAEYHLPKPRLTGAEEHLSPVVLEKEVKDPVFYIVRHGATGDDDSYNSPENPSLNGKGLQDAQAAADFFRGKKVGTLYASAMKRADETAKIIGAAIGKVPILKKALDSLDVGTVANMKDAGEADRVIKHHQANPTKTLPGGESIQDLERRVRPEFREAIAHKRETGLPDVLVAHHSIQHEAGKYFNNDKDSALTDTGGVTAVYEDGKGGFVAEPIYKPSGQSAEDVEKRLSERGIDPEKFEEAISPGIHEKMAETLAGNKMKKHNFSHTVVEHHEDGTHTVHHIHKKHNHKHEAPTRDGDVKGAVGDHDAMIDHMMDNTSEPNPGEAEADQGQHGIPPAVAAGAGIPPAPAQGE